MNRLIENFIKRIKKKRADYRKLVALLCVLSVFVSAAVTWCIRLPGLTLSGDPQLGETQRVADNVTWDDWTDRFGSLRTDSEYAGGVWTDKSVSATSLSSTYHNNISFEIAEGEENFLVGLSAIGSTISINSEAKIPTDTMIILDLSSSMYRLTGNTQSPASVRPMVDAVNSAINSLLSSNPNNRVGVVAYYGNNSVNGNTPSTETSSTVFLELDRYQKADTYLTALGTTTKLEGVESHAYSLTKNAWTGTTYSITGQIAGTYMQLGILRALEQFESKFNDTTVKVTEEVTVSRKPIFIFMTDGVATAANSDFSDKNNELSGSGDYSAEWGLNSNPWRSKEETDFVTQLTASYAKKEVSNAYDNDALFYSMGFFPDESLKTSKNANGEIYFSEDVVDPMGSNRSSEIEGWWNQLISGKDVSLSVYWNTSGGWSSGKPGQPNKTYTVKRTVLSDGNLFPSNISQLDYVDNYYSSGSSTDFNEMFTSIIIDINEKIANSPTYVVGNNNQSGYVTFIDDMSNYMEVKKIDGVVLYGKLYDGWNLAQNFNDSGENVLGTAEAPTEFGNEFYFSVIGQLGIDELPQFNDTNKTEQQNKDARNAEVRTLIGKAYAAEQLKGVSKTDFSNYIGWYADENDSYLGFWNDKNYGDSVDTGAPGGHTAIPSGAKYGIKSYFFLNEFHPDSSNDTTPNLMYLNVWVRTELATQQSTVVFGVPASLLPLEHYNVGLDSDRNVTAYKTVVPDNYHPIRLIYRVGLDEGINADTLTSIVDAEYIENNMTEDGRVKFYSNDWERNGQIGYGTHNTYSYFRPALTNDRFYYTEGASLYIRNGSSYELYTGQKPTAQASNSYFTRHMYYVDDGDGTYSTDYYWMPASAHSLSDEYVEAGDGGSWYIKAGVPQGLPDDSVNQFASWKTTDGSLKPEEDTASWQNYSGTLGLVNMPYVDTSSGNVDPQNQKPFILGATLGNNGMLSLAPPTQNLRKTLVYSDLTEYTATEDTTATFLIHEGEKLDGVDYTNGNDVWSALNSSAQKATLVTLTVPTGESESQAVQLSSLQDLYSWSNADNNWVKQENATDKFQFIYNQKYTIYEFSCSNGFAFQSIDNSTEAVYTFTCGVWDTSQTNEPYTIEAANKVTGWQIDLTKYDSEENGNVLEGAVFGLYTPLESEKSDTLTEEDGPLTYQHDGKTWYLFGVEASGADGKFSYNGLTQEEYLLIELEAPPGYYIDTEPTVISRSNAVKNVYSADIANTIGGPELPKTGANGILGYIIAGTSIILLSVLALLYVYKAKYERKVKKP